MSASAIAVVKMATKQLGIKFVWAGADPKIGFDSSGLVIYCFKQAVGMTLPHYAGDLIKMGTPVTKAKLKAADIIFPNDHHVGIYIGSGQYIHAPHNGEVVKIDKIDKFYAARRLL